MKPEKELLERVVSGVLEEAAFIFALPREAPPPGSTDWSCVGVRQAFRGPITGHCEIWAPFELAKILSSNMLGMEEGCPDAQEMCFDAMKEALNILCGSLLTEIAGEEPVFHLGTPGTQRDTGPSPADDNTLQIWLDAEGHPILFRIRLEDAVSEAA